METDRRWEVWRQDDAGNRFLVRAGLTPEDAQALVAEFEARGHRQHYWAYPQGVDAAGEETVVLYRPVGQAELDLIRAAGFRAFPPRLPGQPLFYPVLNEEYAVQIARDWNTGDAASGFVGYVTRFRVRADHLARYKVQTVGRGRLHEEYWVPAEELAELNANLVGPIEVVAEYRPPPA
jgi:hypothetical protein